MHWSVHSKLVRLEMEVSQPWLTMPLVVPRAYGQMEGRQVVLLAPSTHQKPEHFCLLAGDH